MDICSICLEELNNYCITNCNHKYHLDCLNKSIKINYNCPLCRKLIKSIDNKLISSRNSKKNTYYLSTFLQEI